MQGKRTKLWVAVSGEFVEVKTLCLNCEKDHTTVIKVTTLLNALKHAGVTSEQFAQVAIQPPKIGR